MNLKSAIWIARWYALDQPLEVGTPSEFYFWKNTGHGEDSHAPLFFYNATWSPGDALIAHGIIGKIQHETLGSIKKIYTKWLDYSITLENGKELLVNAEEEPGTLYEKQGDQYHPAEFSINDWTLSIEFDALSEPQPA